MSDFVVEIVGDKTFSPKATSVPTFDKIIDDGGNAGGGTEEDGDTLTVTLDELKTLENVPEGKKLAIQTRPGETLSINDEPVDAGEFTMDKDGEYKVTIQDAGGNTYIFNITIIINRTEHVHSYTETITKEPTCTEPGEKKLTCSCGDTKTEVIPAKGHNYKDGVCTDCGDEESPHVHSYTEEIIKEPICEEVGKKKLTCGCGDIKTETIPATGHNYENGICTKCGEAEQCNHNYVSRTFNVDWVRDYDGVNGYKWEYESSTANSTRYKSNEPTGTVIHNGNPDSGTNAAVTIWKITVPVSCTTQIGFKPLSTSGTSSGSYTFIYLNDKQVWENTESAADSQQYKYKTVTLKKGDNYVKAVGFRRDCIELFKVGGEYQECNICGTIPLSAEDWNYELNESDKTITLKQYIGADTDVIIGSTYLINGTTYKTNIASNSNVWAPKYMFYGNKDIKTVTFEPNIIVSDAGGMVSMFRECTSLTNINLSGLDISNVTDMTYMFYGCTSLADLDLSGLDTGNVINMNSIFRGCTSLTDLDLSGLDTSNVTNMLGMFVGCTSLTDLDLSGLDTSNVININSMFAGCTSLTDLDLSGLDTSNVTNMNSMFANCTSLISIDLSNFNTSNVLYMNGMFKGCTSLKTIYVTQSNWSVEQANTTDMFADCGTSSVTYVETSADLSSIYNGLLPVSLAAEMAEDEDNSAENVNGDTTVNYGIGDSVPFKLTATMPDSISAYETYKLVFHDSMTDGLTYDEESLKVFVGDAEIPAENYTVASDDGMKSFTVTINDAKAEPFNATAGTEVSVKYTATLNDSAAFKNINNAWLEYSNNPNGEGTGTTVSDDVTAFTFTMDIDKVDKDGNALDGAGFTLYKKVADGEGNTEDGYVKTGDEVTGGSSFEFTGLAVGDYKLVESTTPDGYNTMEDLEFRIVADSTEDADGNAYVTGLKIVAQGGTLDSDIIEGWTADTDTGMLSADIANYKGSELPSTGGMGTMMFYVVGGCIMVMVFFMLVKRKEQCAK